MLTYKIKNKKDTHHAYIVQVDKYITKHTQQFLQRQLPGIQNTMSSLIMKDNGDIVYQKKHLLTFPTFFK